MSSREEQKMNMNTSMTNNNYNINNNNNMEPNAKTKSVCVESHSQSTGTGSGSGSQRRRSTEDWQSVVSSVRSSSSEHQSRKHIFFYDFDVGGTTSLAVPACWRDTDSW